MGNFIGMVYGFLKQKGIDTSKMSTEQAIAKFNELKGEDGKGNQGEIKQENQKYKKFTPTEVSFDEEGDYIIDYNKYDSAVNERNKFFANSLKNFENSIEERDFDRFKISLDKYTGGEYYTINKILQGEHLTTGEEKEYWQKHIDRLDMAINEFEMPEPITVFRNVSAGDLEKMGIANPDELVGKTLTNKGFSSTSLDEKILEGFAKRNKMESGEEQITLKINVPKGKGVGMPIYQWSNYKEEQEVLLKRDAKIKITSADVVDGKVIIEGEMEK